MGKCSGKGAVEKLSSSESEEDDEDEDEDEEEEEEDRKKKGKKNKPKTKNRVSPGKDGTIHGQDVDKCTRQDKTKFWIEKSKPKTSCNV